MNYLPLLPVAADKLKLAAVTPFLPVTDIPCSGEHLVLKDLFPLFQYAIIPTQDLRTTAG